MAEPIFSFRGLYLGGVQGKKVFYLRFKTQGVGGYEFQISCPVEPDSKYVDVLADWQVIGLRPVSGYKDGKSYAYFSASSVVGQAIKS